MSPRSSEDADFAALEPGDRDHLVRGFGELGLHDEWMCQVGPDAVLDAQLGKRRRGRLGIDAARDDPAAEAGDVHHRGGEMRLGHLVLVQPRGTDGIEKDEVGSEIRDQAPIERWGENTVDGEQISEVTELQESRRTPSSSRSVSIVTVDDPGELAGIHDRCRRAIAATSKSPAVSTSR